MRRWLPETDRRVVLGALLSAIALLASGSAEAQKAPADTVTVFAAASLKTALDAAAKAYADETGAKVTLSYAASSALAKQIEQGAPADLFIGADLDWMDYLAGKGLIDAGTRIDLLGNKLVLVTPASRQLALMIAPGFKLAEALDGERLAIGDPKAVPVGKYAKAALESLGVWSEVEGQLAPSENVRAALALVATGEAPLGIVYATDAAAEPKVKVVAEFPESSHPPIVYPAAVTKAAASPEAAGRLLGFLRSDAARNIFKAQGFMILP